MSEPTNRQILIDGIWYNNPIFLQLLGMCPTLATSTNATNGFGMGVAATAVLIGSNIVISMIRNFTPNEVRIPIFIVVIAAFVTIIDLAMNAYVHDLHKVLGIFIPLIVVNCIILGRAEAFASKYGVVQSIVDGLGQGLGFTLAITVLGAVREFLGTGKVFGLTLLSPDFYHQAIVFILPPGAFLALGFILAGVKWIDQRRAEKAAQAEGHSH